VLTIAAVAAHKQITLETIAADITCQVEKHPVISSHFDVKIDLGSGLTRREKTILLNVARSCEVSKMLKGGMAYEYELIS
jgi:uncharacterized OsmC-like protein